ncbi:MAG: DUF262 domain-containing protein [Clostridia bacterium]|nr:DUF262 domain-containing protein [Clostridia bacterium]
MAKSNDTPIHDILKNIDNGTTQLPDFQRGWVWDDERIRRLIASITCSYPIGAVMFLEYGGDGIRFKSRTFTNVTANGIIPKDLVLDGQQRLTSVYCAMYSRRPVPTQTVKKENIERFYYLDIVKCLDPNTDRVDGIISVPSDKKLKEDFGRAVVTDVSTRQGEFEKHLFPLHIVFDSIALDEWKDEYRDFHSNPEISRRLREFTAKVLNPIILYTLPVIQLDKETPKEAVCQVFENVNTGGVALTVFELVTASFATEDFVLRDDWDLRFDKLKQADGTFELLSVVSASDFLVSMTLLAQVKNNRTLSCKRKDVLSLSLMDYKVYADMLTDGYIKTARFLVQESILSPRDLPYTTQLIPLAVLMTVLGDRTNDGIVKEKLSVWYWCGVFGEMYGAANETRYANDISGVLAWIAGGEEPDTVRRAFFQPTRLLTLQTRNGAAYKGIMALILHNGACDFISGDKMDFTNFVADYVDIHHVFPQNYCERKGYEKSKWNSIVNKTPIAYRTNRKLGGDAPSKYLKAIENTNVSATALNANIASHGIDVKALREDDFYAFFAFRAKTILDLIGKAMGKSINNLNSTEVVEAFGMPLD